MKKYFSSGSVTEGHPDKVCDGISDSILDACLAQGPNARETSALLGETAINGLRSRAK